MTTTSSTSTTPTTSTSTTSTTTSTSTTPTTTSTSTTPITTSTASTPTATSTTSTVKSTTSTSTTQTTTSTTSTVKSTTSCSTTTTSPKPTSITTTLKTSTTTSTTSSKCSVTAPAPTCEYGCGSWCSKPLPWWNDQPGCQSAAAKCALQVADCLASAGWPSALQCFEFASWCQKIQSYGSSVCAGGACSKSDCLSKNPPQGGPTTTTGICTPTSTTSHAASMTTSVCPPTATNVCVLPSGSASSGYYKGQCVGGIEPPYVTCNNIQSDFYQNPFKCYTSKESSDCPSYSRGQVSNACQDACNHQYSNCKNVYANSCQGKAQTNSQDSYSSASQKCTNQLNDCMNANRNVYVPSSRCPSFNSGWN
ncbi:hypothetical protein MMC34_002934 [Xylographa carneopallida]|nr:hypothetical protein [Xylographa carneopallida]